MKADDPEKSSREAVTELALSTLAVVREQEQSVLHEDAWEALHDYRVALRRLRSLLGSIKGVYSEEAVTAWRTTLSSAADATGTMRDLDVHILSRSKIVNLLPEDLRRGSSPFFTTLQRQRRQAHRRLAAFLQSKAYQQGMAALESGLSAADSLPESDVSSAPIREQAAQQIARRLRQMDRRIAKLADDSPDGDLHLIRITGKKLRYLLDFFSYLFEGKALTRVEKQLTALQRKLGNFNDACVQQETLARYAQKQRSPLPSEQLQALGGLRTALYGIYRRKRRAAREALSAFATDSAPRRLYKQLQKQAEASDSSSDSDDITTPH